MKRYLILSIVWLILIAPISACNVHYGSPQAVWFYCTMLGWCTP